MAFKTPTKEDINREINRLRGKDMNNEDWPKRDDIPVDTDPIGDVERDVFIRLSKPLDYIHINFITSPKFEVSNFPDIDINQDSQKDVKEYLECRFGNSNCTHPKKYKNIISCSMKFWFCPDCGKDWDIEN